jgi:formate hydrogenlyase subunit 3/multisubunit Na+/H+ antiporter MnhD subunit
MNGAYVDLVRAHAPLLVVTLPLTGAALTLVSGPARLAWLVAGASAVVTAIVAVDFALIAFSSSTQSLADVGVPLHSDGIGSFGAAMISCVGALVAIAAGAFLKDAGARAAPFALALVLCMLSGWNAALVARDLVGVFIGVETAWLASVALTAAHLRERGALNGAFRMLGIGGVGSALTLLGVGLVGRSVGSLDLNTLPIAHIAMSNLAGAGVMLALVGLAAKAAVAPAHAWAAAALGRGGATVGLCIGGIGIAGALLVLIRLSAYAITAPELGAGVSAALAVLGAISVVIGSVQAVGARTLPRLAVYACASQTGCVLVTIALGSPAGFAAALVQTLALSATALALFGGAAAGRIEALAALDGFGQRAPLASAAITAGALSLMGAPMTIGFLGRWRLVEAGVGAGWWWASVLVIIASLAGVFYGGRLIERMYFRRANTTSAGGTSLWRFAVAPSLLCAIAVISLGFAPGALLRLSATAASMLTGIGP